MRVFMCVHPQATDVSQRMEVWKQWLDMLRVDATIVIVHWNHEVSVLVILFSVSCSVLSLQG